MAFTITTDVDASPDVVMTRLMRGLNQRYLAEEAAGLERRSEDNARAKGA